MDLGGFAFLPLSGASGLALDAAGNVYVTGTFDDQVRRFSATGADLGVFAFTGPGSQPFGVRFGPSQAEAVPEPGSLPLLSFGMLVLLICRERRRQQRA
jgi:hypothetical protein